MHGLTFVARDTRNHAPRFAVGALETDDVPVDRLGSWYRRFVDTRSSDAAERTLETALAEPGRLADVETMMFAAVTDHVFIDGGHTIDFTNKAFEAVEHLGKDAAGEILPTLVRQTTAASRSEEFGEWRHPHDHAALAQRTIDALDAALDDGPRPARRVRRASARSAGSSSTTIPRVVAAALLDALRAGADEEQVGRAIAYAAALRIARFHVQNDHGDWDTVHHAFTAANGLHQALQRRPSTELLRGAVHAALRINLDRFLNVPAARPPARDERKPRRARALLRRAGHGRRSRQRGLRVPAGRRDTRPSWWPRSATRCSPKTPSSTGTKRSRPGSGRPQQWPEGSEEAALVLTAVARFLAAHTPDAPRAPHGRAHRHPAPPRRSAVRGKPLIYLAISRRTMPGCPPGDDTA